MVGRATEGQEQQEWRPERKVDVWLDAIILALVIFGAPWLLLSIVLIVLSVTS